ncbi:glycine--tRNA ligase subunit beta [Croceicoccus sp. F390]|uniref:Glycine--tRNA ligase beta subunit n=1 Tax=Croceicoccus esteveae TaxID=3075597 RepID=A0ABU2ZK71_9SPHN|nr:glycine--tRNA ligase subunit beta [Croceicoccus sp. F390]MDT0576621.1 glycine--tRNA ligase subunit beta [Croceicoccus sp. F390]
MSEFLLELRSEEIPARMQARAREELQRLFCSAMHEAGVACGPVTVWSTPRRLALIARDLPARTSSSQEEIKGPRTSAPQQALDGFLRKTGVSQDQLEDRGGVWFAIINTPGRDMAKVLADVLPDLVLGFAWPKSMRWGKASVSGKSLRWVRPLSGIVAILGEDLVPFSVGQIRSGFVTVGHRFHHDGQITIGGAGDYQEKLRACHVIVDHEEREAIVRHKAELAARGAELSLVEDEALVIENAGLTEWPMPLLGRFDDAFLDVPAEVIQLTARANQKYFICRNDDGQLANAFVCTANLEAADGGNAIIDGNRKVLAARLADARFFWSTDRSRTLSQHAEELSRIVFHERLGTIADKAERVARLARWLVESGAVGPADADLAALAARLTKADLVTQMVGEFPELQGIMGGHYARAEGLPEEVADAIRDHYTPVGHGDSPPAAPVSVAVALADKLDSLVAFFMIEEQPTGSKDPFALRRATLGIISIIVENRISLPLTQAISQAADIIRNDVVGHCGDAAGVQPFIKDRLKVQQRAAGARHDLIDAVLALGNEDDLLRILSRVNALQTYLASQDGVDLLAAYKRAANILKREGYEGARHRIAQTGEEDPLALVDDPDLGPIVAERARGGDGPSYNCEPAEQQLVDALDQAENDARELIENENFAGAMAILARLRAAIDVFFDEVTVKDVDAVKRTARLALLDRFRNAVHQIADFSRIES